MPPTHAVTNQVPPLMDVDVASADPALHVALAAGGTAWDGSLAELGIAAGSAELQDAARLANEFGPRLRTHDARGNRIDEVEYHPAYHLLMARAVGFGLHAAPWSPDAGDHPHLRRAAGFYAWNHTDSGHLCPISMTYAAVPALRHGPALADRFEPGLRSLVYDVGLRVPAGKHGLLAGMSMTEKQGGSDVQANTTRAEPIGAAGEYRLTGHKWFTSAPMNDLFLTLAQAPGGLTSFVVPRVLEDGSRNAIALQRLKDKLGNRSNASAEIEYDGAVGYRLGDEGRGVPTIIEMVSMTRLDCVLGSAGQVRAALSQATHHAAHRSSFDRRLVDHPAMTAVLADLAVESWADTVTALRLARAVDDAVAAGGGPPGGSPPADGTGTGRRAAAETRARESAFLRLALPAAKFWVCKRAVPVVAEALECLGGNGYVEDSVMPRLLRESPLNSIWEGSGTVTALDAVRALARTPASWEAVRAEVGAAAASHPEVGAAISRIDALAADPDPRQARTIAALVARVLAAAELTRLAPEPVADLYCATRLGAGGDRVLGDIPDGYPIRAIVAEVTPQAGSAR
jgi:putative acyl-CoA dehydrogenase